MLSHDTACQSISGLSTSVDRESLAWEQNEAKFNRNIKRLRKLNRHGKRDKLVDNHPFLEPAPVSPYDDECVYRESYDDMYAPCDPIAELFSELDHIQERIAEIVGKKLAAYPVYLECMSLPFLRVRQSQLLYCLTKVS